MENGAEGAGENEQQTQWVRRPPFSFCLSCFAVCLVPTAMAVADASDPSNSVAFQCVEAQVGLKENR